MAAGRLKLHQIAGKEYSSEDNAELVQKVKAIIEDELQGYRDVSINPDGRLYINTKTNPINENQNQQILSLLMSAYAEKEALLGRSSAPDLMLSNLERQNRGDVQELIGRGLIHPTALTDVASRGFRHPSRVSTDDLIEKLQSDIFQRGRGYDPETGAAFTLQDTQSGHKEDHNLRPELGQSIDNIAQQARIVNQVTADSAKDRSNVNPKYKSIVDQRNKALKMIQDQYKNAYEDIQYNDDGGSDIYGSALDDLIETTRSDLTMDSKRFAGENAIVREVLQAIQSGRNPQTSDLAAGDDDDLVREIMTSMRQESPGDNRDRSLIIDSGGGDVSIGQDVLRTGKSSNGNGNGKVKH